MWNKQQGCLLLVEQAGQKQLKNDCFVASDHLGPQMTHCCCPPERTFCCGDCGRVPHSNLLVFSTFWRLRIHPPNECQELFWSSVVGMFWVLLASPRRVHGASQKRLKFQCVCCYSGHLEPQMRRCCHPPGRAFFEDCSRVPHSNLFVFTMFWRPRLHGVRSCSGAAVWVCFLTILEPHLTWGRLMMSYFIRGVENAKNCFRIASA